MNSSALAKNLYAAYTGSLVADAVAMPVHWYYDTAALDRDYGPITGYQKPKNPHAGSILWRSTYTPVNERGDILREQAQYWGQRGVHYHQFLAAGENTLNFQLARELHHWATARGGYEPDAWLEHYIECMLAPGWHRDTYVEEYHRGFFTNYAQGKKPNRCGISDVHIGGLAQVPALCAALTTCGVNEEDAMIDAVATHIGLTHRHDRVIDAGRTLARLLIKLSEGWELDRALEATCQSWISISKFKKLMDQPDRVVVGQVFSPACYIDDAFPAALYLAWRHQQDFSAGVCANAMAGGDNCHRGAVVGSLLGAVHGVGGEWLGRLKKSPGKTGT
jgi:ADP-ribosyl-[dinitrogen reductase] hydrolase